MVMAQLTPVHFHSGEKSRQFSPKLLTMNGNYCIHQHYQSNTAGTPSLFDTNLVPRNARGESTFPPRPVRCSEYNSQGNPNKTRKHRCPCQQRRLSSVLLDLHISLWDRDASLSPCLQCLLLCACSVVTQARALSVGVQVWFFWPTCLQVWERLGLLWWILYL